MSTAQVNELKTIDGTKSVQVADIADGNVGIGVGQTWQNVTEDRELEVEYVNDTGRPINASVSIKADYEEINEFQARFEIDGTPLMYSHTTNYGTAISFVDLYPVIIPAGSTYRIHEYGGVSPAVHIWTELR